MLAKDLINRLERLGLLDQEIIEALREQLDQGGTRVTPEAVAKLLVDNGQLTHFQATKLIGELRSGQYEDAEAVEVVSEAEDLTEGLSDLGMAADATVEVVDDGVYSAEPIEVQAVPVSAVPVEVEMIDEAEISPENRPKSTRRKPDPQKSVWDSFKIYGYAAVIVILLLLAGFFAWVLKSEDADEVIGRANKLYDQQNYQGAQDAYLSFLDNFGEENQYSSISRTRITMTELYKSAQFKQEPWRAVDLAKEKLPLIAEEEGMNQERGNLAALLVEIAASMARAAGKTPETTEKESLLAKLDEHFELMQDPLYLPSTMRATLSGQIKAVEEARDRVRRDINRNKRLDASELAMKALLEEKKTREAYDTRKSLLRDFPELHDNERMVTLIRSASDIQQTLVEKSPKLPKTITDAPSTDSIRSIDLVDVSGRPAPDLRDETYYLRAGGSILAFDGETGKLKWRRFVGYAKDLPPVSLDNGYGVLLSDSSTLEIFRCEADSGDVAWRSQIDEVFVKPISVGDEIYVSARSGRLVSIDTDSGDSKWATQLPQPLETSPGVDDRAKIAYLPGNHSNLYAISTRDGSCVESFYIGHKEGTIAVPPVPLLGHLFVIENAGAKYSMVHVLRVDETGKKMRTAQPSFRLTGNVRVAPVIQGRRLIVLTDLGEVTVFDIEPTAEKEQVDDVASLPAFYDEPTATQMAVGRTSMWITGTRIGRYELQINTGRVVRDWSLHELDTFIGQPYAGDDTLIHSRVLRDTSAIRVTAANPKTGEEIWRTDVGVPVAMIQQATDGFHAVTSQGTLFKLDGKALADGSTSAPLENPGANLVAINYVDPAFADANRAVMVNQVGGQSMLYYDPSRRSEKVRIVNMNLPVGQHPSGGTIVAGGGLLLALDGGRVVLSNLQTGAMMATPFQPASDPTEKVKWTDPVALPDDPDQVVLADNRKTIYRLRVAEQIKELASKELEYEFLGPAAAAGGTFVATTAGPSADFLVGIDLLSLDEKFKKLLDGRVMWGPASAGELCLVETADQVLRGFTSEGKETFQISLPAGSPVGRPIMVDGKIVLAGQTGWLVSIDGESGKLLGQTDLGQPLSATPLSVRSGLLVPGVEGVIYITEVPQSVSP